jgi:hypothetical protein
MFVYGFAPFIQFIMAYAFALAALLVAPPLGMLYVGTTGAAAAATGGTGA